MTTMTPKRKAAKKSLRIRPEFLPDSARYATIDEEEYVMIPVRDFAGWYEDIEDRIIVEERRRFDDGPHCLRDTRPDCYRDCGGSRPPQGYIPVRNYGARSSLTMCSSSLWKTSMSVSVPIVTRMQSSSPRLLK